MSVISPMEMVPGRQRWIDVRDRRELHGPLGHIEGAENVPLAELADAEGLPVCTFHRERPRQQLEQMQISPY